MTVLKVEKNITTGITVSLEVEKNITTGITVSLEVETNIITGIIVSLEVETNITTGITAKVIMLVKILKTDVIVFIGIFNIMCWTSQTPIIFSITVCLLILKISI